MKKTFINIETYSGMDWHDKKARSKYLSENGSYEITNPDKVILDYVISFFDSLRNDDEEFDILPSTKEIEEAIKENKKVAAYQGKYTFIDEEDGEKTYYHASVEYIPDRKEIHCEYACGQITHNEWINVIEIEESDVRYIVAENFLCPNKGVPSIERFYDYPVKTQEEAQNLFKKMKLHKRDNENVWANSAKEILILDVNNMLSSLWYAENITAIKETEFITKQNNDYPDVKTEIPFRMDVESHIEALREVKEKQWKEHIANLNPFKITTNKHEVR